MKTNNTLALLLGPSGTGKSTLIRELCQLFPSEYAYPLPFTTRQLRENETDKIHISVDDFLELGNKNEILCPNKVHETYYGPPKSEVRRILSSYRKPILDWPVERVTCIAESLPEIIPFAVYMFPPDLGTLQARINSDNRDPTGKRYEAALQELSRVQQGEYSRQIDVFFQNEGDIRQNAHRLHFIISKGIDEKIEAHKTNGDETMEPTKIKLKNDKYRTARGGEAHLLEISCTTCSTRVLKYQKDGKGNLKRCYLNRIFHPPEFEKLQYDELIRTPKDLPNLACLTCKTIIGTPMYHDDGRLAYRLIPGKFSKKRLF